MFVKFVEMLPVMKIAEPSDCEGIAKLPTKTTFATVTTAFSEPNSATYKAEPPTLEGEGGDGRVRDIAVGARRAVPGWNILKVRSHLRETNVIGHDAVEYADVA